MKSHKSTNANKSTELAQEAQQTTLQVPISTGTLQLQSVLADPTLHITPSQILQLQKTVGNRTVMQLMKNRLPSGQPIQRMFELSGKEYYNGEAVKSNAALKSYLEKRNLLEAAMKLAKDDSLNEKFKTNASLETYLIKNYLDEVKDSGVKRKLRNRSSNK